MRKFYSVLFISFALLFSFNLTPIFAQDKSPYQLKIDSLLNSFSNVGSFVIKGNVKNFKGTYIDLGISGYVMPNSTSLMINPDGSFEQSFPITKSQQFILYSEPIIGKFTVFAKDTLEMNWDQKNFLGTFSIKSNSPFRNATLQTELLIYKTTFSAYTNLMNNELNNKKNPSSPAQKYEYINSLYNKIVKLILGEEKNYPDLLKKTRAPFTNLIADQYFIYSRILFSNRLLEKFPLKITDQELLNSLKITVESQGKTFNYLRYPILDTAVLGYKNASEPHLTALPSYRDFIYDYVRLTKNELFNSGSQFVYNQQQSTAKTNFTLAYYHKAKQNFTSDLIRDWFMTMVLSDGFRHYAFEDVKLVYDLFLIDCKTPIFKANAIQNFEAIKTLKPGLIAPNFTLKDLDGKNVSLTDFKGKVVYLDFWGISCGPCIYEFENHNAKLKAQYKDQDIVYLYVCVDSNEKEWKNATKKYKLDGTNLIATGWDKNPACKAYNISGIPHYILINKDGTLANNNAPRPSELLRNVGRNDIDMALKKP